MNSALIVNTYLLFLFCQYFSTRQWKATVTTGILFSRVSQEVQAERYQKDHFLLELMSKVLMALVGSGRRSQGTTVAMESREGGAEEEAGSPAAREMLSCGKQTFHQQGGPRWAVGLAELSRLSRSLREISMAHQNFRLQTQGLRVFGLI